MAERPKHRKETGGSDGPARIYPAILFQGAPRRFSAANQNRPPMTVRLRRWAEIGIPAAAIAALLYMVLAA